MRTVRFLATFAVLACLIGCGSGGSSVPPQGPRPDPDPDALLRVESVEGRIVLPPGFPYAVEDIQVENAIGQGPVASDGRFSVASFREGPLLTIAVGPDGDPVLVGWVGPDHPEISLRSTAEVLLHLYAALHLVAPVGAGDVLDEVAASQEAADVEAALVAAVAGGATTIQAMTEAAGAAIREAALSLTSLASTASILIDPLRPRSGIHVDAEGFTDVLITNTYRRRAHAWVERVGYQTTGGAFVESPAGVVDASIAASPGFTGFWDLFAKLGSGLYTPVKSGPHAMPLFPADAESTRYRVTVVGLGLGLGDFAKLSDEQAERHAIVATETLLIDILFAGILSTALPKTDLRAIIERLGSSMEQFRTVAREVAIQTPIIVDKARNGQFGEALRDLAIKLFSNPETQAVLLLQLRGILGESLPTSVDDAYGKVEEFLARFSFGYLQWADFAGTVADLAVQAIHIKNSNNADVWDVDVYPAKVTLLPMSGQVRVGEWIDLEAVVQDGAGEEFEYRWSIGNDELGFLRDVNGNQGAAFTSSEADVQYYPEPGQEGRDACTVEVYRVEGAERHFVGKARSAIDVRHARPLLVPKLVSVRPGDAHLFTAKLDPEPILPPQQLYYVFTSPETAGTFQSPLGEETGSPHIAYVAGADEGTDSLTVEVFEVYEGRPRSFGTATAEIRVETRPSVIQASFELLQTFDGGRHCTEAMVPFSPPEGARSLQLHGYGSNDPWYYGSSISRGASRRTDGTWNFGGQFCEPGDFFHLSGSSGPASGAGETAAYYTERFGGFSFHVVVQYDD